MNKSILSTLCGTLVVMLQAAPLPAQTAEQLFFEWTSLPFPQTEFRLRRQAMMAQLQSSGGGTFLVPSGEGTSDGGTFRQENDFLYFTGLELPGSILAIDANASRVVLFAPRRDARLESESRPNDFPGRPLADDPTIGAESGIDDIRTLDQLEPYLATASRNENTIRLNLAGTDLTATGPIATWGAAETLARHISSMYTDAHIENASVEIARLRMIKSDAEITLMRRVAGLTANAIMSAAGFVGSGIDERGLEAEFESSCKRGGSQRVAFASIIKSGPNSLWPWRVLAAHYNRRNRAMVDGDLVVFDVGCELDYYASDVGRTFPVSGRFTSEQRDILEMVTRVSDSIIGAVRPGMTLRDLQRIAESAIPTDQLQYMQTGLFFGHHVGLAVGDPSIPDAMLEPGMVFTVEPWYYNHDRDIAVFVEDMVLVTAAGAQVLTASLPRSPEDLERLVNSRR